ncbi:MAG: hypothetical protein JSU96_14940, partial [Acidobacteriota bacterium]
MKIVLTLIIWLTGLGFQMKAQSGDAWTNLSPGPYPVGFRLNEVQDPSRFLKDLSSDSVTPRTLRTYLWYPGLEAPATRLTLADYLQ